MIVKWSRADCTALDFECASSNQSDSALRGLPRGAAPRILHLLSGLAEGEQLAAKINTMAKVLLKEGLE